MENASTVVGNDPNLGETRSESVENTVTVDLSGQEGQQQQEQNEINPEQPNNGIQESDNPEDILSKVTRYVSENKSKVNQQGEDGEYFNIKEIEAIEDPNAKEQAMKAYKSFQRGFGQKYQELAEMRKELASLKENLGNSQQGWSVDRVKQLMNDPNFVKAAQEAAGFSTEEDDEYVPESVKNKLKELDNIKKQLGDYQYQQTQAQINEEHKQLKQRYGVSYNEKKVDEIRASILQGKVIPNSEDIHKVLSFEETVTNAYKMGLKAGQKEVQEKQQASTYTGGQHVPNEYLKPEKDEGDKAFWRKIVSNVTSHKNK